MKHREEEFCLQMAALGDPVEAARRAGYQHPEDAWPKLIVREDIAERTRQASATARRMLEEGAVTALYRMVTADQSDAFRLLYADPVGGRLPAELNLSGVSEVKRTDKGVELKFFDRMKLLTALSDKSGSGHDGGESGLIEAIRLSAKALGACRDGEPDAV